MQSAVICSALRGHFHGQIAAKGPAQILSDKCEIIAAAKLSMGSKALQFCGTAGTMLRSKHGTSPAIGARLTNDWCRKSECTHSFERIIR